MGAVPVPGIRVSSTPVRARHRTGGFEFCFDPTAATQRIYGYSLSKHEGSRAAAAPHFELEALMPVRSFSSQLE